MIRAGGVAAGIKASGAPDLALIDMGRVVPCAAVFTGSQAAAAPVVVSRAVASRGQARAVVINSGCANAGTGSIGMANAKRMQQAAAKALGCGDGEVLVCSTGPIGPQLPIAEIETALSAMDLGVDGWVDAAEAIRTTDTFAKVARRTFGDLVVQGMAKGAAMIRPDMATMLAVLTTNADIDSSDLDACLREAVTPSFNSLNIDGCQSTNDTVIAFATSEAGGDLTVVRRLMAEVCMELAVMIARDGEETNRVVHLTVVGATTNDSARRIGRAMTDSDLVRSSFYGGDPNWGRLLQAAAVSEVTIDPQAFAVSYQGVAVAKDGCQVEYDPAAVRLLLRHDFGIEVRVGWGPGTATIITTDLTPGYVEFNGAPS
ncbi:MAG: bifunctional glutamate N-acetyltransferase/amino-acid acetyltransferase ArgJ [Acidimicrobiia bacterium]|nr:bifunctional glutamate N-acetyltransferase/amino-acid acetyltransferase ArgJ [Acidimicrobiia bacterium]MDH5503527.1 bifunctional glutamate N-acetyltransferase/amino-acid acetyltransferase ArgJ [Acidimicrobiia bacterium]